MVPVCPARHRSSLTMSASALAMGPQRSPIVVNPRSHDHHLKRPRAIDGRSPACLVEYRQRRQGGWTFNIKQVLCEGMILSRVAGRSGRTLTGLAHRAGASALASVDPRDDEEATVEAPNPAKTPMRLVRRPSTGCPHPTPRGGRNARSATHERRGKGAQSDSPRTSRHPPTTERTSGKVRAVRCPPAAALHDCLPHHPRPPAGSTCRSCARRRRSHHCGAIGPCHP